MVKSAADTKEGNSDLPSEFPEFSDDAFKRRLAVAMNGESTHAFAKRSGIPDSTLRNYVNHGSMPGLRHLLAMATAANVTMDWLAAGRGVMRGDASAGATDDRSQGAIGFSEGDDALDFTLVPRLGVSASAGHGLVALAEEVTERLAFKTDWLRDMGLSPAFVGLVTCRGDSQDPVIKDGALMLVDLRPDQVIRSGCFYVVVVGGDVLVKRVNRLLDGTIELISHNPAYRTERIDSQQLDQLTIPGRVVWAGQKL